MLVCIQYPIIDIRKFVDGPTRRLELPGWPCPDEGEFIRGFGAVKKRRLGGIPYWAKESRICDAKHALRFHRIPRFLLCGRKFRLRCAYRRFYFDGKAVGKLEVGFRVYSRGYDKIAMQTLIRNILELPVYIGMSRATNRLVEAANLLAEFYLYSSTSDPLRQISYAKQFVRSGVPIVLIEYNRSKLREDDRASTRLTSVQTDGIKLDLEHRWAEWDNHRISTWLLGADSPHESADRESQIRTKRTFRVYLLRLHIEHQCLLKVLGSYGRGHISQRFGSQQFDNFQAYVNEATKRLRKWTEKGETDYGNRIVNAAKEAWDFAEPGERASLLERLEDIRPQVKKNALDYLKKVRPPRDNTQFILIKEMKVDQRSQNVSGQGNIVVQAGDNAQQSIKLKAGSETAEHIARHIDELSSLIQQLADNLDATRAEELKRDFRSLSDEMRSGSPRFEQLKQCSEWILEKAKTSAELMAPIASCLEAVLGCFM